MTEQQDASSKTREPDRDDVLGHRPADDSDSERDEDVQGHIYVQDPDVDDGGRKTI